MIIQNLINWRLLTKSILVVLSFVEIKLPQFNWFLRCHCNHVVSYIYMPIMFNSVVILQTSEQNSFKCFKICQSYCQGTIIFMSKLEVIKPWRIWNVDNQEDMSKSMYKSYFYVHDYNRIFHVVFDQYFRAFNAK